MGHPRPSRCHADDGGFGLNGRRAVAAQRIGEECQKLPSNAGTEAYARVVKVES